MHNYLLLDKEGAYDKTARAYKIVSAENEAVAEKLLEEGRYTLRGDTGNFEKARILLATTYYDSTQYSMMDYEKYAKMCRDNDEKPYPEGSQAYYDHIGSLTDEDLDAFKDNLQYSKYNLPCLMTGTLDLWNGRPGLCPVKYGTLLEGVKDIMSRADCTDWEIRLTEGTLHLHGKHHDGTNTYTLHVLSAKGLRETERPKYTSEGFHYEPRPDWFKKIYGWLF